MILNLTPHAITVMVDGHEPITFPPDGRVARAATFSRHVGAIDFDGVQIDVVSTEFGAPEGLPDPEHGVRLIVSAITAAAAKAAGRSVRDLLLVSDPVRVMAEDAAGLLAPDARQPLYGAADVARAAGVTVQAIWNRWERGAMPRPAHMTVRGRPLWTRASLIAEGVLSVGEDGMTDA